MNNNKGSKVDFVSTATKKDISPNTVPNKVQGQPKLPPQIPLSSPSKPRDQSAQPKRHKLLSPPSMQKVKTSETASPKNYLERRRIFSMPEPGSLGQGTTN